MIAKANKNKIRKSSVAKLGESPPYKLKICKMTYWMWCNQTFSQRNMVSKRVGV